MNNIFIRLITVYNLIFSPILRNLFGAGCRFTPSCSVYASQCYQNYSFTKATYKSIRRVLKCHPLSKGGYDPVLGN